jgi:hypothetical protein
MRVRRGGAAKLAGPTRFTARKPLERNTKGL